MNERKKLAVLEVIKTFESMLATAREGRKNAIEESRHHKGAMESRYDTFKEEAQYLMTAQDIRISELSDALFQLRGLLSRPLIPQNRVGICSLIEIETIEDRSCATYLVLPVGGGVACVIENRSILTINALSPLASALMDSFVGDEVEVNLGGKNKTLAVISIS